MGSRYSRSAACSVSAPAQQPQPPTPGAVQDTTRERPAAPTLPPALIQAPPEGQKADPNAPKFAVSAVSFTGNSIISTAELQAAAKPLLAPQMNLADLNRVAEAITELYRNRGYRLARAVVVAQRVENGVVRIEILEGKLGKIDIHGNKRYSSDFLGLTAAGLSLAGGSGGHPLRRMELASLLMLNDLPGVTAQSVLKPGAAYGTTDLDVDVQEKAVGGNIGVNNFGPTSLGRNRFDGSLDINNPLRIGDQLSAHVIEGINGHLDYRRLAYSLAAGPYGTRLGLASSYTDYRVGGVFSALGLTGESRTNEFIASQPLIRSRLDNLLAGFNLRDTYSNQNALGVPIINNHLTDGVFSLLGSHIGLNGAVSTANLLITTNGRSNSTGTLQNAVAGKFDLDASHLYPVARNFDLFLRAQVVYSDRALPDIERFGVGGPDSVRAFSTSEARGDRGYQGTVEGRYRFTMDTVTAVATVVVDGAQVHRDDPGDALPKESLLGAGFGLTIYPPAKAVRFKLEYAHRLDHHNDSDNSNSGRLWASLIYTY